MSFEFETVVSPVGGGSYMIAETPLTNDNLPTQIVSFGVVATNPGERQIVDLKANTQYRIELEVTGSPSESGGIGSNFLISSLSWAFDDICEPAPASVTSSGNTFTSSIGNLVCIK